MKDIDILYYDSMMESVIENRKITEFIMGSSFQMKTITESSELAIYEGKVIETVINSIKEIFQKVIDFVRNVFKNITGQRVFTPNEKLIKSCEEKFKNMSKEDKDNFLVENISVRGITIGNQNWAEDKLDEVYDLLFKTVDECTKFIEGNRNEGPSFKKEDIDECLSEISKRENVQEMKKNMKNVDIITVELCLDPSRCTYANAKKTTEAAIKQCKEVEQDMKKTQDTVDKHVKNAKSNNLDTQIMSSYRTALYAISNCILRLFKFNFSMVRMQFKNEEKILHAFMTYKPQNESVEFESDLYMENGDLLGIVEGAMKDKYEDEQEYRTDPNREQGHTRDDKEWEKRKNSKNDREGK